MSEGLPREVVDVVADGAALRRYRLLLGAGASADAIGGDGTRLPLSRALIEELARELGLQSADPGELSFSRLFRYAETQNLSSKLVSYIERRFTGCRPPGWYEGLLNVPWVSLWTLNVDDVLDRAYRLFRPDVDLAVREWNDRWAGGSLAPGAAYLVYLHGRAATARRQRSKNLVFSMRQYLRASTAQRTHHKILADELTTQPFVILGARLIDEWDLAEVLELGTTSLELVGLPSVVVLRSVGRLERLELEAAGFIVVEAAAGDFIADLAQRVSTQTQRLADESGGNPNLLAGFSRQFVERTVRGADGVNPHDFYAGYDPNWDDVVTGRAADLECYTAAYEACRDASDQQRAILVCLLGPPFSGKSTGVLHVGRRFQSLGFRVFQFEGTERLDVDALEWWISVHQRSVFLIDNVADIAADLANLFERMNGATGGAVFIGCDRHTRRNLLFSSLDDNQLVTGGALRTGRLTDRDIDAVIEKLNSAGRLGFLSDKPWATRRAHFRDTAGRSLFDAMADLEGGRGFRGRLRAEFHRLSDHTMRSAYLASCVSYAHGYSLPISVAADVAGCTVPDLVNAAQGGGHLAGLLEVRREFIKPHHRRAASLVLEEMVGQSELFPLLVSVATNLAPYVTPEAIARRTIHHRILSRIMDNELLAGWLGADRVDGWYDAVKEHFDWNARYWEQRALHLARRNVLDRAESYATRAVAIRRDPFTLNTLGTVLMRKAVFWYDPVGSEESVEALDRAIAALREARESRVDMSEHPYLTFFRWTLEFARRAWRTTDSSARGDGGRTILKYEWPLWVQSARGSVPFSHGELRSELERMNGEWFKLSLTTE